MRRLTASIRPGRFVLLAAGVLLAASLTGCGDDDNPVNSNPAPAAPANVQAAAGDAEVTVSWDDVSGATSYNLYFDTTADVTTDDSFEGNVTSAHVHGARTNGTTYYYGVTAVGAGGQSVMSAIAAATPAGPPVYVSPSMGNDTNDGTQANPLATFAAGYALAQSEGRSAVRMEAATFTAPGRAIGVEIVGGVNLEGGFDVPAWTVGASRTLLDVGTVAATANNITVATTISNVEFRASSQTGANSIALYSTGSGNVLQFDNCLFGAADAGGGVAGIAGASGLPGGPGSPGFDGACNGAQGAGGSGGEAGAGGGCPGGPGGSGGLPGDNDGLAGSPGGCNGGIGGQAGFGDDPGTTGLPGGAGAGGFLGQHGSSASADGGIDAGQWVPLVSLGGSDGSSGTGGGGGGGGGGGTANPVGGGNGGGGGGGGGQGGFAGTGAGGGYGSFAVFLFDSSPTFTGCEFELGTGGTGGSGGNGGTGGDGGAGGEGAATCTGQIGAGGNGGLGGGGGAGGAGAGGPGGSSYGVYKAGTSVPVLTGPTYTTGTAGAGGAGGIREGTADQAPNGTAGVTAETN